MDKLEAAIATAMQSAPVRERMDSIAFIIPAGIADEIAIEATEMTAFEDFVLEKVQEGRSILGLYPPTEQQSKDDFLAWRKLKSR